MKSARDAGGEDFFGPAQPKLLQATYHRGKSQNAVQRERGLVKKNENIGAENMHDLMSSTPEMVKCILSHPF